MRMNWMTRAIKCCGRPIFFYSGLYVALGLMFIVGSLYLDPDMGTVGLILLLVGVGIFLIFLILAYRSFRQRGDTPNSID
jgi:TRAP-type C4-dicarboxylate transport system permease small subunit